MKEQFRFLQLPLNSDISYKTFLDLGVVAHNKSGTLVPFLTAPDESFAEVKGFVGPEYEGRFSYSKKKVREALRKTINLISNYDLHKQEIIDTYLDGSYYTESFVLNVIRNILGRMSEIIYEFPHYDGQGIEVVLCPATLKAHQILKPEYERILEVYKELGFTDKLPGAGFHIYIDYTLFGNTEVDIVNNYANFLWLIFNHPEEFTDISNRQHSDDINSDLLTFLGDPLGILTEEELLKNFLKLKAESLTTLGTSEFKRKYKYLRLLNISYNRDGRPALEFRWFGSTLNINTFMAFIEFGFAMPEWTKTFTDAADASLNSFCNYIKTNVSTYIHLYEYFTSIPSIMPYMNLELTVQQAMPSKRTVERILVWVLVN